MPCTNVVLRLRMKGLTQDLWNTTIALAEANGVSLAGVVLRNGELVGYSDSQIRKARDWVLAAATVVTARKQGYRVEVAVHGGKVVVAGVTA